MLLAGDVGGTKTLHRAVSTGGRAAARAVVREYATLDFDSLDEIVDAFLDETGAGASMPCAWASPVRSPAWSRG